MTPTNRRIRGGIRPSFQKLQERLALAFGVARMAGLMEPDLLRQRLLEFVARFGVFAVEMGRVDVPLRGDVADRQVVLEPQPEELDAPQGVGTAGARLGLLPFRGAPKEFLRPGAVEGPRGPLVAAGHRLERRRLGAVPGVLAGAPLLEPEGDVADDGEQERAELVGGGALHPPERAVLAEALDEGLLDRVVDLGGSGTAAP